MSADVYTNTPDERYPGGKLACCTELTEAHKRTRPGSERGEQVFEPVLDRCVFFPPLSKPPPFPAPFRSCVGADRSHGRRVSSKPANRAILADQRARAERARRRAERERLEATGGRAAGSASLGSILSKLLLLAIFLPALSHFLTGTYHFGLEDTVRPWARKVWRHPANPFASPGREFTLLQLAAYDGADETRPVYLSIGGVVYDVSANRRVYGRGGSYNMM